ncbi:hypothetical protein [Aliikangiella maris]|uniref:Uncharacterized protein n=2 Tax=Aliikangiella maris TaxID=3162458 RepID=A0ABV3MQW8_9GAMM
MKILTLILLFMISSCKYDAELISDEILIDNFNKQISLFDEMVYTLNMNRYILRLTDSYVVLDERKSLILSEDLKKEILDKLIKLKVKNGISRNEDFPGVFLHVQSSGYVTGGISKGYYYSRNPPSNIVDSLNNYKVWKKNDTAFYRLQHGWYMFLQYSG